MKSILLILSFTLFSLIGMAQLSMHNGKDVPYNVAIGYFHSSFKYSGWVTEGWITIEPGDTVQLMDLNPREKFIYYYAISQNDTLSGYRKLLVHPTEKFKIIGAIMLSAKEENPAYEWYKFREVKRGMFRKFKKTSIFSIGD